jgi:methionyl-tRNA synthetase
LTIEGRKIGKSSGNAIDPVPLSAELGPDALRYYLLRSIRPTGDGDFSHERFRRAYQGAHPAILISARACCGNLTTSF